jgi:hypothetical protein
MQNIITNKLVAIKFLKHCESTELLLKYLLFNNFPANFCVDKEVMLAAVQNKGLVLYYASAKLQADKELVLAAVQNDGAALDHASEELQGDKEVVLAAVQNKGLVLLLRFSKITS